MDLFSSEPVTGSLTGDAAPPANPLVPSVSSVPIGRPGTAEFVSIEAALAVAELGRLV
jgi:hypothetical protein